MNLKLLITIAAGLLLTSNSPAGDLVGNGGDALVCKNSAGKIDQVLLYDFYEAKVRRDVVMDVGGSQLNVVEKVQYVLDRLSRLDLYRADLYRKWLKTFFDPSELLFTNDTLSDISDTGEVIYPTNCKIQQVAHQKNPLPGEKRYYIKKDIWDLMDNNQRAGLILHELIYREFKYETSYKHQNSVLVRYFNSLISSNEINNYGLNDYIKLLEDSIHVNVASIHGLKVKLWDYHGSFGSSDEELVKLYSWTERWCFYKGHCLNFDQEQVLEGSSIVINGKKIVYSGDMRIALKYHSPTESFDDINIISLSMRIEEAIQYFPHVNHKFINASDIFFNEKGEVRYVHFNTNQNFLYNLQNDNLDISVHINRYIGFENEKLIGTFRLNKNVENKVFYNGGWRIVPSAYYEIKLSEDSLKLCKLNNDYPYGKMDCYELKDVFKWNGLPVGKEFFSKTECSKQRDFTPQLKLAFEKCEKVRKSDSSIAGKLMCTKNLDDCSKIQCSGGLFKRRYVVSCLSQLIKK